MRTRVAEIAAIDVPGDKHPAFPLGGQTEKHTGARNIAVAGLKIRAGEAP